VLISLDRLYYDRMKDSGILPPSVGSFPDRPVERRIPLAGNQMRIGRRSANGDFEPEIDLAEPLADRGVSRLHAVLVAAPDGTWSLMDSGSANGTFLNGSEVATGAMVPVREGDRINLGAWTAITLHRG
jgi:pSer/pThr/pTyr-binding forkhead associated (FHA) protein